MCLACIYLTTLQKASPICIGEERTVAGLSLQCQWVSLPPHGAQKGICSKQQPGTVQAPSSLCALPTNGPFPEASHCSDIEKIPPVLVTTAVGDIIQGFSSFPNTLLPFGGHHAHIIKIRWMGRCRSHRYLDVY